MTTEGIEAILRAAQRYCFNVVTRRRYLLLRLLRALGFTTNDNVTFTYTPPEGGDTLKVTLHK